jgi:hypothetical protein
MRRVLAALAERAHGGLIAGLHPSTYVDAIAQARSLPELPGVLIGVLGWGLNFRSGVGVLLTALMVPPIIVRIRAEKTLLSPYPARALRHRRSRSGTRLVQ